MQLHVRRMFKHAFEGVRVVTYEPGVCEVPEEAAKVALEEGWATHPEAPPLAPAAAAVHAPKPAPSGHRPRRA